MKALLLALVSVMALNVSANPNIKSLQECVETQFEISGDTTVERHTDEVVLSLCKAELVNAVVNLRLTTAQASELYLAIRNGAIQKNIRNAKKSEKAETIYEDVLRQVLSK